MSDNNGKCFLCGENAYFEIIPTESKTFYSCDICGKYEISERDRFQIDKNYLSSYLFYSNTIFSRNNVHEYLYYIGSKKGYADINKIYPQTRLVTKEEVLNWYPSNFNEKVDISLLGLANLSDYVGDKIFLKEEKQCSLFFIKRYIDGAKVPVEERIAQIRYFSDYMSEQKLIDKVNNFFIILPDGWKRIDELQKHQTDNKQAFVAIAFSEDMQKTQEAIEEGIRMAGYTPHVMNKSEHNNQIVPEILYQIKQSKFVVAEFSTNNNGAYYEAGYAAGLGKEVIHICKKNNFGKEGHFDIKQKSTILWETEGEIAELLFKRIEATINTGK
jgi:nucleoside 2-deoxyribosyltransferase